MKNAAKFKSEPPCGRFGDQSPDWRLNIKRARVEDSGVYECQINTEPKKSKKYQLLVIGKLNFSL